MVETSTKSKGRAPMRITAGSVLILCLLGSVARAEQVAMQLEWGLGPTPSEMYWDGQVRVMNGRLISMKAVSFEPDRHDQMRPPEFKSFTVNNGTDGMELIVDGDDSTAVGLVSLQGNFEWKIADLRKKLEVSFPGKDKGRLVVRLLQSLGDVPSLLSDRSTQDSDPAMCRLADGRQLILWRAFLGLPTSEPADNSAPAGDQIRGVLLDREGNPGQVFDVLPEPGDVDVIAVAPAKDGGCRIVWAELRQKNWDLYCSTAEPSSDGLACEAPEQLTDEPGVDKTPAVATTPDGSLALVWQGWRGTGSNIYFRQLQNEEWKEPICLSDDEANDWNPAIAASADGSIAVAWSRWQNGSYDICLRVREGDQWGPVELVAATDRFEAHPSVIYDDQGTLWIAYEEGRADWGMDSHTAGLRSERNVRVSCRRNGQLQVPRGTTALALPEALRDHSEMATLATDGNGVLWLFVSLRRACKIFFGAASVR
ncbi:MAG: hypothetical protein ISR77_25040 [Pirellulaceae bacterium]|nr:hypothetical protein [Pirellulaceae bacterium]